MTGNRVEWWQSSVSDFAARMGISFECVCSVFIEQSCFFIREAERVTRHEKCARIGEMLFSFLMASF